MNGNLQWHAHRVALHPLFPGRIGIWECWFLPGGRNTGEPGERPSEQAQEPAPNSTHVLRTTRTQATLVGGERHPCSPLHTRLRSWQICWGVGRRGGGGWGARAQERAAKFRDKTTSTQATPIYQNLKET